LRGLIKASAAWESLATDPLFKPLALELFQLQTERNPVYRHFVQSRSLAPVRHWSQIPAAPTSGFKEFEFSCLLPEERTRVFQSSGTTRQRPSCHYHSEESLGLYEDSAWAWFESRFLGGRRSDSFGSILVLTPPPGQAPHSSLVHMFELVRQRMPGAVSIYTAAVTEEGAWELDLTATQEALQRAVSALLPVLVLGTAFSFVHLLDQMSAHGIGFKLPTGSLALETGGYKGRSRVIAKAELHKLITRQLGIGPEWVISEYGMSELSSQAYDVNCPQHVAPPGSPGAPRLFRFPPWARVQIISPETGEEVAVGEAGLIRVFDLANAFSVMAVQTEDLGVRHADGFQLAGRAALAENRGCSLLPVA